MKSYISLFIIWLFLSLNCFAQINISGDTTRSNIYYGEHEDYLIGEVSDAKLKKDQVYIIDQRGTKILVLSKEGELIQQVGRSGRGPGEYEKPVSLDFIDDELLVLDQNLNRITRYTFAKESAKVQSVNSGSFDLKMTDICVSEGEIFVHSFHEENIIQQISSNLNTVTNSFGSGYGETEAQIIRQDISSDGILACQGQYIYSGFTVDNKIKIYDKNNGELKHQIVFDEIAPIKLSKTEHDGKVGVSRSYYPGQGFDERGDFNDTLKNIVVINEHLIVQYKRTFSDAESDRPYITSLIVDPENGTYTVNKDLPFVYDYNQNNDYLLTGLNYPVVNIELIKNIN